MKHIAIMKKSWDLIPKILSGQKTIESRWYKTRRAPWNKARPDDIIFFKNVGEAVVAQATVSHVFQFEIKNISDVIAILRSYGKEICLVNNDPYTWEKLPRYGVLIRLKNPGIVQSPFHINKHGFGNNTAWITTDSISKIKIK